MDSPTAPARLDTPRSTTSVVGTLPWPRAWAGVLLGAFALIVLPSLGQSLVENYAYRQTQTAYTAVLYAENGIDLFRPPLPVLGIPGVVPLEFPLFQAIGSFVISTGVSPDAAIRVVGLVFFLASAIALFLLATRLIGEEGALVTLAAFLFNAHALVYGRAALIEYVATAGGLAFLLFALRWLDRGGEGNYALALLPGTVATLVKITTAPIYLLLILAWRTPSGEWAFRKPRVWVLLAATFAIGLAWNGYADAIRISNLGTEFLAARNQVDWFFGTVGQRLELASWRIPVLLMLTLTGFGAVAWAVLAIGFARRHGQRAFLLAALGAIVVPVLVLFNLYARHEYYYAAIAPLIALAVGMGAMHVASIVSERPRRLISVGLAGAWVATLVASIGSWTVIYGTPQEEARIFETARYIRDNSSPDDWVVIDGHGWNSAFLYYARRQGYAVPGTDNLLEPGELDLDRILADPIYGPFFTCDPDGTCQVSETR